MFKVCNIILTIIALGFIFLGIYKLNLPNFEVEERGGAIDYMEAELKALSPIPDAVYEPMRRSTRNAYPNLYIRSSFQTGLNLSQVRAYYGTQLQKRGWTPWRSDKWLFYRKGEYEIEIDRTSSDTNPSNYQIEVSWKTQKIKLINGVLGISMICAWGYAGCVLLIKGCESFWKWLKS